MPHTPEGLVTHALRQLQTCKRYIYAGYGNALTAGYIDWSAKNYPEMWKNGRVARAKTWVGTCPRAYDCAGLVKSYWMQRDANTAAQYAAKFDKSADGLFACCTQKGAIATLPEIPGTLVFMATAGGGKMHHVGIYMGGGQVVEARGADYGIVQTAQKTRGWTHWGALSWFDAEAVKTPSGPSGQLPPGGSLDKIAREVIDGKWGNGDERRKRLTQAGFDAAAVQGLVNKICGKG